ncbi:MAG: S41 family peptidase [Rhodothermia bacterium]|nr:MAG: S41 family peptidase [Rhodothermia bacterium]
MKHSLRRYLIPALLVFGLGGVLGMSLNGRPDDDPFEQLKKIQETFMLITQQYVEDVNPEQLAEGAIQAMIKELDPHTIYIDAENVPAVQDQYMGSFGGIGIWFEVPANDTARVTSTFPDGPSERLGIMAGDRMIAVDNDNVVGVASLKIQNKIKGPVNTIVKLTVARPGVKQPLEFNITRAKIPLFSVDASYMIDEQTGYVRIGRFALTTAQEFRDHVGRLKSQGLERLIVDLRGNPGGVKGAAVDVADEMLDGSGIILSTRGRNPRENEIDRITKGGTFSVKPVIVLVDESSASGSEIVAGALQDHDRALIVGRRTFGKGLVQRPFQLNDGSIVQMTVARYYMPSGRLIQTPYSNGETEAYYAEKFSNYEQTVLDPQAYLADIPDSLKFTTDHGRTVFGGGGVMPDVVIAPDTLSTLSSPLVQSMLRTGVPFLFVRKIVDLDSNLRSTWNDRKDEFIDEYVVPQSTWDRFLDFSEENGYTISSEESDHKKGLFTRDEFLKSRSVLAVMLKARIAQRLFRSEAWYPVFNQIDPVVQAALEQWTNAEALSAFHAPGAQRSSVRGGGVLK